MKADTTMRRSLTTITTPMMTMRTFPIHNPKRVTLIQVMPIIPSLQIRLIFINNNRYSNSCNIRNCPQFRIMRTPTSARTTRARMTNQRWNMIIPIHSPWITAVMSLIPPPLSRLTYINNNRCNNKCDIVN